MPYEQAQKSPQRRRHELTMTDRERMSLTGVDNVSGFDESVVVLTTACGDLTVRGEELHVERIDLEAGLLELCGRVQSVSYDEPRRSATLWQRLFG